MEIRKIIKGDIIRFNGDEYEVLSLIDIFDDPEKIEKSLFKIEIRMKSCKDHNSAVIVIDKEKKMFFVREFVSKREGRFIKNRFVFRKTKYILSERFSLLRNDSSTIFFEKARIYLFGTKGMMVEKKGDEYIVFSGTVINDDDVSEIRKSGTLSIPERIFIKKGDLKKPLRSIPLTVVLSIFFLFLGLLYVSPAVSIFSFALTGAVVIAFGWKGLFVSPLICVVLGVIGANRINRMKSEF